MSNAHHDVCTHGASVIARQRQVMTSHEKVNTLNRIEDLINLFAGKCQHTRESMDQRICWRLVRRT